MEISSLKTGMILEFNNGDKAMVLLNTDNGDIISGDTWAPIDSLTFGNDVHEVCKVYQPNNNAAYNLNTKNHYKHYWKLIWEYSDPTVEMTLEQVCKALNKNVKIVK